MADLSHLDVLRQGVEVWNRWRTENSELLPDLSEAELSNAKLSAADFRSVSLQAADLSGADLSDACFHSVAGFELRFADLRSANLRGANLGRANLLWADLRGANLGSANLLRADLRFANLRGASFRGATLHETRFHETVFGDTDLSAVIDLDTCFHQGPSTVDHRTLAKSGRLPLRFLRGCGLPDALIDYLPSLLNEPIQFYSCFISYSTDDQEFADRLYADLQNKGVRCWFAPHDMQAGKKIHEQIDEAIRVYQRLLLILSPASMDSEWVRTEIAKARKRELREKRRMLFPVRLVNFEALRDWECFDADAGKDSAREIREYYVPDFSNWKDHDCYQREFDKLLRDLKLEIKVSDRI
jgi:uncharacterized protein YjbI with pentapeptide repeats